MNRTRLLPALYAPCSMLTLESVTIVYNLRISQITRRQAISGNPSLFITNLFQQWSKFRTGLKQTDTGLLASYIHTGKSWYLSINCAGAHVESRLNCTKVARNQIDDILLTGGYGITPRAGTQITFSGHVGIPTHKDTILDGVEFGTGHYGISPQVDGSQTYKVGKPHFLLWALRLIHFFPRSITSDTLPFPQKYHFALGNVADIFLAHQSNWAKRHRIEFGYDGVFGFGAKICPTIANFGATIHYIHNNVYVSYAQKIKTFNKPSAWLLTISYGAGTGKSQFRQVYGVTLVGSWAINF